MVHAVVVPDPPSAPASLVGEAGYRVASSGATSWTSLDGAVSGLSARIDGVVNLVPYDVQVRAVNTRGGGAWATATAGVLALVDAGNDDPAGMWSDGTTVYLGDNTDDKIYAYSVATGAHDAPRDFQSLGPDVSHIGGIWADDETLYVVDPVGRALYAFDRATKLRDPGNDILRIGVPGPDYPYVTDVWSDGETLWILDSGLDKLYAYNLETKQPRSHLDFDLSVTGSRLWSDGETVWIGDYESAAVVAYSLSAKSRDSALDVRIPGGDMDALWSDGTTLWVVDSHTVEAVPLDRRPRPPGSLSVVGGDTELALAWQAAPDGVGYEVQYRNDEGPSGWVEVVRDDPSALTETIAGLTNGAFHQVRVRAESASGLTGRWSAAAGTPVVAGAPGAPLDLAAAGARETPAEGGGDRALVVEWEAPPGSGTVGYEARYRRGGSQASWTSAAVGSGGTARIAGLEKGALYEVQVRAVAGGLAGPWATAASRAGRGFYSIGPFAEGIWSDRETMWVSEWLNTHARIRAYDMATKERVPELDFNGLEASALRYPGPMWSDYAKLWVVNDSFFADRRVGAYDHDTGRPVDTALSGVGSVLDDAGNTAPAGIWGAAAAVWISDWRDNKIYVYNQNTGRRSHSLGLDLVEPYHEDDPQRSMSVAAGIWSNGVTMWVADKVQPRIYAYRMSDKSRAPEQDIVFASNVRLLDVFADLGEMFVLDDVSSSIISLVLPYPPAVPRNLAVVSQDAALDVSWLGTLYEGSSVVTGYAVRYFDVEHPDEVVTVPSTSALSVSLTGLGNGRTYRVEVQALNSESYSDWVGLSATPVGPPGMVAGLFAAADNSALNVSWRAPGDGGGRALAGYDVEYRAEGAASWTEHASATTALSARIVSLTNEQRYEVQVRARNGVHTGEWATVTVAPLGVPDAPGAPSATSEDRELEISWAAPGNGGASPVTGYDIQYRAKDSPGSWTLDRSGVAAPSWTVDGLDNGVVYEVQVRARNSLGPGRWSPSVEAAPFTVPGAPAGVAASPGDEALVVQWDAPADDGGNAVLDYKVQYRTSSPQGQWEVDSDAVSGLTWTIDGLVNTTAYNVSVQARNTRGHGRAASSGAVPSAAPGLPRNVRTESGNRELAVRWDRAGRRRRQRGARLHGAVPDPQPAGSVGAGRRRCVGPDVDDRRAGQRHGLRRVGTGSQRQRPRTIRHHRRHAAHGAGGAAEVDGLAGGRRTRSALGGALRRRRLHRGHIPDPVPRHRLRQRLDRERDQPCRQLLTDDRGAGERQVLRRLRAGRQCQRLGRLHGGLGRSRRQTGAARQRGDGRSERLGAAGVVTTGLHRRSPRLGLRGAVPGRRGHLLAERLGLSPAKRPRELVGRGRLVDQRHAVPLAGSGRGTGRRGTVGAGRRHNRSPSRVVGRPDRARGPRRTRCAVGAAGQRPHQRNRRVSGGAPPQARLAAVGARRGPLR